MNSKTLIFLLLGAITISSARADYWDDADVVVVELEDILERTRVVAYSQQQELSTTLTTLAESAALDGQSTIEAGFKVLTKQLSDLQILGDAVGTGYCLEDRQKELQVIADDLNDDITQCIQYLESEARSPIINLDSYMYTLTEQLGFYRSRMRQCPRAEENEWCIVQIIDDMQIAKDQLPAMVLNETLRLMLALKIYEDSMTMCADNKVGLIYTEGNRIVLEVENCIIGAK